MLRIITILLTVVICSCGNNNKKSYEKRIDSLINITARQDSILKILTETNTPVFVMQSKTLFGLLTIVRPSGLDIRLSSTKPIINDQNYFSIPAAYTSKATKIDGIFIVDGIQVNKDLNKDLNGFCVIEQNNSISIDEFQNFDKSEISNIQKKKASAFQQSLLINHGAIVNCPIFKEYKNLRRALVKLKNGKAVVAMSDERLTILEFQKALKDIGAESAVNLDMGSWSEGWIKDDIGNPRILGENMVNTHRQTNWLTFTKRQ